MIYLKLLKLLKCRVNHLEKKKRVSTKRAVTKRFVPLWSMAVVFFFFRKWNEIKFTNIIKWGEEGWVFILERNSLNMFLHGNHQIFFLIQSLCPSQTLRGPNCINLDSWGPNRGKVGRRGSRRTKMGQGPKHTMLDQGWPSGPSGQ